MSNNNKLGLARHFLHHVVKTADIGIIQRGIDLIENTKGRRLDEKDGENQCDRGQGLFPAGKQVHALQLLTRRLHRNIDARLQQVLFIGKFQLGLAAEKKSRKDLLKALVDLLKGLTKAFSRCPVNFGDG